MSAAQRLQPFGRWFVEKAIVPIVLAIIAAIGGYYVAKVQAEAQQRKEDTIRDMLREFVGRRAPVAYVDSSQPPDITTLTSELTAEVFSSIDVSDDEPDLPPIVPCSPEPAEPPEFERADLEREMRSRPKWVERQVQQQVKIWDRGRRSKK